MPLSKWKRWQLAAALTLVALAYLFLTGREFVASVFVSRADLLSLQRAVRLSPGNADYYHRLGRYYAYVAGEPGPALDSLRTAVTLNPHDAHYWFDLAAAYQVAEDPTGQRESLERALQAEPTAPYVAWEAANFFLIAGDVDRALSEFRVVIGNDNSLMEAAMQAAWRARPDADALLRDAIPARIDTLLGFIDLLRNYKDTDGTIEAWNRLLQLHEKFDKRHLFDQVNFLIGARRTDAALSAWQQSAALLGLSAYLPTDDNLVVNGDFSLDILNGGFDWTYVNRNGVKPVLDPSSFRQGHRSLSITFEGPGFRDAGVEELIPVHGPASYDFSAYYKSADFEGAGGVELVLRDAYTGTILYTSDSLRDADFWKEVHSKVTVPASTSLLVLGVERSPAGSPITGKLWLEGFQLSPDDGDDTTDVPSDHGKGTP